MTDDVEPPPVTDLRRAALRQALAVGLPTGLYGASFGALSVSSGLSVPLTMALSLLLFSGGSQFAFVGVVGSAGTPVAAVVTSTLLGLRNGMYGLQVARFLPHRPWLRRLLDAHLTIDESTAVGIAQPVDDARRVGFWVTGGTVFVGWNLFTLLGALAGDAIGDPRRYGLDAMAASAFLALVWPRLHGPVQRGVAVGGALVALAVVPVLPPGLPVVAASVAAIVPGVVLARRERA